MSDNLPQRPHWRTRPSSPSCHVRFSERAGISHSRARHRVAEIERDVETLFECYVAAGDASDATARPLLRQLGSVLHRTQRLIGALRRAHPEA